MRANTHCYVLYIYVDLDTSTAAPSSDDEQLSLDPSVDDPQAEDDEDAEEEPVEEPTAAENVEVGVSSGQVDSDTTIPVDQRAVDEAEERLIQQFAQNGCKCDLGPNRSPCPCCTTTTAERFRSVCCQMTHDP